jgi:hypothetical protein
MPNPFLTAIPAPPEETVIAAVLATLRDDPVIVAAAIKVEGPEGDRKTLPALGGNQPNAPNLDNMPLIRMSLGDYPVRWQTEGTHEGTLTLNFDLFVQGTHYADRMRMWSAWHGALFPQDPTRRTLVKSRFLGLNTTERMGQGGSRTLFLGEDQYAQQFSTTFVVRFDIFT